MNGTSEQVSFLHNLIDDGPVTILHKKDGQFILELIYDSETKSRTNYTAGSMQAILANLKHEPAKAIELEAAIADIEEQMMPVIKELHKHRCLVTTDRVFWNIAEIAGFGSEDKHRLDVGTVEAVFNRLVDVAYGTPASRLEVPETREFAATVLFLRELMHHANYSSIILLTPKEY